MIRIFNQYASPKSFLLVGLETVVIALSLVFAAKLRFWNNSSEFEACIDLPHFALQAAVVVVIYQLCFYINDLYNVDAQPAVRREDQVLRLGQSLGAASLLLGFLYFLIPSLLVGRGVFLLNMVVVTAFTLVSRIALDRLWLVTRPERVLVLGGGPLASTVAREIATRQDLKLNLVGVVQEDRAASSQPESLYGRPILGHVSELEAVVSDHGVARIVVAVEDRRGVLPTAALVKLRVQGVVVEDAHTAVAALTGRVWLSMVRPSWFVFSDGFYRSRLTTLLKRMFDICFGILGLMVSLPVMAAVAVAIKLDSRGPVLYRQERVGWKSRSFEVLKFRSMRVDAEAASGAKWASVGDPRVTRLGKYLRKFRLDELPQFWNVVRGDMSFVGPRPERPVFVAELRKAIPYYDERHSVRPGLTGWAQVRYPYGASVEDAYRKLEYDLFYLKNMSVLFDSAIVFYTLRTVLTGTHGR
jgi:sugar transferase (PEP-CTERM system associated)